MSVTVVNGIVTRYTNYRENDRILTIFSPEIGRIDVKSRGCRRMKSPLLPCSQPFVYGEFELYRAKDKYTLNQCEIRETFFPIRENYDAFSSASAILQLVTDTIQENEPNEALFSLVYHTLSFLAYGTANARDLLACFLIRFLNLTGFRPSITVCARCGRDVRGDAVLRFSARSGGVVCAACDLQAERISKTALEGMRRMLLLADSEMDRVRLSETIREETMHALSAYTVQTLDCGQKALQLADAVRDSQGRESEKP